MQLVDRPRRAPAGSATGSRRGPLALLLAALLLPLFAIAAAAEPVAHGQLVQEAPEWSPPNVVDGAVEAVAQVGTTVVVGGSFTTLTDNGETYDQPYLAAYDRASGQVLAGFDPQLNGPVHAIADAGDGRIVVGGAFNRVDGQFRGRVAMLELATGDVVAGWRANADVFVNDVAVVGEQVWITGKFARVNGEPRLRLAVVRRSDGSLYPERVDVTGLRAYDTDRPEGQSLDVSPDGSLVLLTHTGERVGGLYRPTVALLRTADRAPNDWGTLHYDGICQQDIFPLPRDAKFDPTGTYFVVVTGLGNFGPTCDVAVRFETAETGTWVEPTWISRLFDQPHSVAVTDVATYVGGHFKCGMAQGTDWTDYPDRNLNFCPAPGAVRTHVMALRPDDGTVHDWEPDVRSQRGVLALEVVEDGLLAGSDGRQWKGRIIGRHALFELPSFEDLAPEVAITSPEPNADLPAGPVTVSGTASDDLGVEEVIVELRRRDRLEWLRQDGSFGAWQRLPAVVASPGATDTAWSLDVQLPPGVYRIYARSFDAADQRSRRPSVNVDVVG